LRTAWWKRTVGPPVSGAALRRRRCPRIGAR
jgi:hypothetical protein